MAVWVLTPRRLVYWFNRLTREVFDGVLECPHLSYWRDARYGPVWGLYFGDDTGKGRRIHIDTRVRSRDDLISTLGHEMIHLWQDQHGLPLSHSGDFLEWSKALELQYGIKA